MESDSALPPPRSLGRALNFTAGASNRACQALLDAHDLQLAQWVVLSALWRRDGLLVSDLARYSGNNLAAASRIVDRMTRRGLVAREADPADRRAVRVRLAPQGRALDHLAGFFETVNGRLLAGFSDAEADLLFALLGRVEANARAAEAAERAQDRPAGSAT